MVKKKEPMTGNDACMLMHTAMRKCCDSHITSLLYNAVHLCDVKPQEQSPWSFFGKLVAGHVASGVKPSPAIKQAAAELRDRFDDHLRALKDQGEKVNEDARTWCMVLVCSMKCFKELDFVAMAGFLGDP